MVALRRDVEPDSRFRTEGIEDRCIVAMADLTDHDALVRVLNEHEVGEVFHLAAQTIVSTANRSPLATWEANVRGTWSLLEACRSLGTVRKIVVASSDKAYGDHVELPYREDFALQPRYPYDTSKACADLIARSYAHTYSLPIAVTRLANIYGPGDVNWSRLVPDTARALAAGERPVIRSDGTPERDYLYVEDAVDAYLAIAASLDRPAVPRPRLERRLGETGQGGRSGSNPDRGFGSGRGARPPRDRHAARRDRPPVPRFERDPRGARLGAALGAGRGAAGGVGVVSASPGRVTAPR